LNVDTAICRILKAEGIDWIAAFPNQSLIDAAVTEGIRPIIVRQERAGVNMADALSRMTNGRKIGVFTMQYGPGAENAFGGVAQAFADSIPILLLPGGNPQDRTGVHPSFDSVENYRGVTKHASYIMSPDRTVDTMRTAFSNLRNGRPGPVLIEVPDNVAKQELSGFDYKPVTANRSAANPDDVRDLVKALLAAKNPVIEAGQGLMNAEATDDLIEFAELTGIPVFTTLAGKSGFPENHPLSLGCGARTATGMAHHCLMSTDFLLGIGTSFTKSVFGAPVPAGVTLAQVTNRGEDLHKDHPADFGAVGDAKLVLRQMIEEAKSQGVKAFDGVAEMIVEQRAAWMGEWEHRLSSDETPMSPYRVFREVANAVDVSNTIVTHDSGYPRDQLVPFWQPITPRSYIGWGKSTQLGYGLGLALGAKMARPDMNMINFMGDAAFGMAGLDIETATRNGIGMTTIVLNNGVMTGYAANYMPIGADTYRTHELGGDYTMVAKGLGAHAERVSTPDAIGDAVRRAMDANSTGQPALIEMMTKEEPNVSKFW
jgi:thiamine pyrophosphate-dependent acetolactate synthase large subunit-like protein